MDMSEILKAAADHGVMMEINAHPSRLDLNANNAAAAKDLGIPIVISTDAHSTGGFATTRTRSSPPTISSPSPKPAG
jgi:DNA polymerase (family 10)